MAGFLQEYEGCLSACFPVKLLLAIQLSLVAHVHLDKVTPACNSLRLFYPVRQGRYPDANKGSLTNANDKTVKSVIRAATMKPVLIVNSLPFCSTGRFRKWTHLFAI